jgi:hypothetical protein
MRYFFRSVVLFVLAGFGRGAGRDFYRALCHGCINRTGL